jgi:hypothetical protein
MKTSKEEQKKKRNLIGLDLGDGYEFIGFLNKLRKA